MCLSTLHGRSLLSTTTIPHRMLSTTAGSSLEPPIAFLFDSEDDFMSDNEPLGLNPNYPSFLGKEDQYESDYDDSEREQEINFDEQEHRRHEDALEERRDPTYNGRAPSKRKQTDSNTNVSEPGEWNISIRIKENRV